MRSFIASSMVVIACVTAVAMSWATLEVRRFAEQEIARNRARCLPVPEVEPCDDVLLHLSSF